MDEIEVIRFRIIYHSSKWVNEFLNEFLVPSIELEEVAEIRGIDKPEILDREHIEFYRTERGERRAK